MKVIPKDKLCNGAESGRLAPRQLEPGYFYYHVPPYERNFTRSTSRLRLCVRDKTDGRTFLVDARGKWVQECNGTSANSKLRYVLADVLVVANDLGDKI